MTRNLPTALPSKTKQPGRKYPLGVAGANITLQHRLALLRHSNTNGVIERFNCHISEVLQQTRSDARASLEMILLKGSMLHDRHLPQRVIL